MLQSLVARAPARSSALAASVSAEPICDIFASGYEVPGATACAGCFDSTIDFDETDVDCGGAYCKACATGSQCLVGSDCQSGTCANNQCTDAVLISQVQTRGDNGGNDEFVELYNPGSGPVTFDSSWTVQVRSAIGTCTTNTQVTRFTGVGQVIPAHGHLLYVNTTVPGYNGAVSGDGTYTTGITDASSVVLQHASTVADALCFYYDITTQTALTSCPTAYTCEGTPVQNPHDNTPATNVDASLERKPGGVSGNAIDTNDNASDFQANPTPDPHNLASGSTP